MKKALWIFGVVLGLGVLVVFAWFAPPSPAPFHRYVAELRAAGQPTTFAELWGPMPPDSENGAIELRAALVECERIAGPARSWQVSDIWALGRGDDGPWQLTVTPTQLRDIAAQLAPLDPVFDLLRRASRKPCLAVDPPAPTTSIHAIDPLIRDALDAAVLFEAQAVAGTSPEARLDAIECELALARMLQGSPGRERIGVSMTHKALRGLIRTVESGTLEPKVARARLEPLLSTGDVLGRLPGIARSHRVTHIEVFQSVLDGRTDPAYLGVLMAHMKSEDGGVIEMIDDAIHNQRWSIRSPSERIKACRITERVEVLDTSSYPRVAEAMDAELAAVARGWVPLLAADALSRVALSAARTDSALRLARIALAAAEHRETRGAWPSSLADLAWAFPDGLPLDRVTDAPFVYERLPDGGVRLASSSTPKQNDTLREFALEWRLK